MNDPMDALITCYQFMIYALFLGFFPWAWTRGICYKRGGIPKFNSKWVVIVVYIICFLIQLLVCSFMATMSKNINPENISAGDKLWIYIKLTVGDFDFTGIDEGLVGETTSTNIYYTRKNDDEIGEELLSRMVANNMTFMFIKIHHLEDFEIKGSTGGWYVTVDDEYIASIIVEEGLFLTEVRFLWDRKKLEERKGLEESRLVTYIAV